LQQKEKKYDLLMFNINDLTRIC